MLILQSNCVLNTRQDCKRVNLNAGCVLVTFKSRMSVPPYRIENNTNDVVVYFAQSTLTASREKWNWLVPRPGGSAMAYAWDEPTNSHRLQVQVRPSSPSLVLCLACFLCSQHSLVSCAHMESPVPERLYVSGLGGGVLCV